MVWALTLPSEPEGPTLISCAAGTFGRLLHLPFMPSRRTISSEATSRRCFVPCFTSFGRSCPDKVCISQGVSNSQVRGDADGLLIGVGFMVAAVHDAHLYVNDATTAPQRLEQGSLPTCQHP